MEKSDGSRDIPDPVKRAVRQRCGFGCVICGLPLYEYEHMEGWSNVRSRPMGEQHVAQEITLLCDRHHKERTNGLLPLQRLREADAAPLNRQTGRSRPYEMHYSGTTCEVEIGSNKFKAPELSASRVLVPLSVDGEALVSFRLADDHLLLSLAVYDEHDNLVLRIADNELQFSAQPWDIELTGQRLVIREAARAILLDVVFNPPTGLSIERGWFRRHGVELLVRPGYSLVVNNGSLIQGCLTRGAQIGIAVGPVPVQLETGPVITMWHIPDVPRTVSPEERSSVLKWARETANEP